MPSTLPLLVFSLVVSAPQNAAPRAPGPSNAERAKMGLLPRRAAPSKVTYLAEAARSRTETRDFPEAAAPPVVIELASADEGAATDVAPAAPAPTPAPAAPAPAPAATDAAPAAPAPAATAAAPAAPAPTPAPAATDAAPAAPAAAPAPPAPAQPTPAQPTSAAAPAGSEEPSQPAGAVWDEPAGETAAAWDDLAPAPAAVWEEPAPRAVVRVAPDRAVRTPAAVEQREIVAVVAQRFVDPDGRIIVRLFGPRAAVVSERVDGMIDDLPVVSARRTEDGGIVEVVDDDWGPIEVRRDPVGRFLSARALPDEGD